MVVRQLAVESAYDAAMKTVPMNQNASSQSHDDHRLHAIVIGSGFGGLAAAARLTAHGYRVTLLEKQDQLGGRAMTFRRGGYVFDAGPTVITAPYLFDELFQLFGKNRDDYVKFVPLNPWYRITFGDGSHFDYGGTLEQTLDEIRRHDPTGHDADGYLKLLKHTKKLCDVGFTQLGDQPFETVGSMVKCAPALLTLGAWRTVWQLACKYLKNDKLRRVFSFQPLLVGGNPFRTTSIYSLIHYLERHWGVHFAMGGTGALIDAIGRLLDEEGVDIRLDSEVAEILASTHESLTSPSRLVESRSRRPVVTGVRLKSGEVISSDIVVCNGDAPFAYKHLIKPRHRRTWTDARIEKMKYSMGLFVLYFGTTRRYEDVKHHTILLGHRYRELLNEIFDTRILPTSDLSLYLHRPTATDPSMAPQGCDAWYVLAPVPNLQGEVDWKTMGQKYRDVVVDELQSRILPNLKDCITEEFYITPNHFAEQLNTLHGTGFSIQPTFDQSAWFRFHNRSEDIQNLFFVGASGHPGAGLPGVLSSAKVMEKLLPVRKS